MLGLMELSQNPFKNIVDKQYNEKWWNIIEMIDMNNCVESKQ